MEKIEWCFKTKKGLKIDKPNKNISESYLEQAENTLSKIKELVGEGDFLWASVRIYYCAYYSLYSFLRRIGVKSENHDCSIELIKKLLGDEFGEKIENFKKSRIDSQYYLKTQKKEDLLKNYKSVKNFYLELREKTKNLSEDEIEEYRKMLK